MPLWGQLIIAIIGVGVVVTFLQKFSPLDAYFTAMLRWVMIVGLFIFAIYTIIHYVSGSHSSAALGMMVDLYRCRPAVC